MNCVNDLDSMRVQLHCVGSALVKAFIPTVSIGFIEALGMRTWVMHKHTDFIKELFYRKPGVLGTVN